MSNADEINRLSGQIGTSAHDMAKILDELGEKDAARSLRLIDQALIAAKVVSSMPLESPADIDRVFDEVASRIDRVRSVPNQN